MDTLIIIGIVLFVIAIFYLVWGIYKSPLMPDEYGEEYFIERNRALDKMVDDELNDENNIDAL